MVKVCHTQIKRKYKDTWSETLDEVIGDLLCPFFCLLNNFVIHVDFR